MAKPRFVQTKKTFLTAPITESETGEIVLKQLKDLAGNNIAMSDFGDTGYITINPGNDNEEIISFTGLTVNDDDTVSIDTNITRGLESVYPYGSGGQAHDHGAGDVVVVSNNPQILDDIISYAEGIANDGAADADSTTKGLFEAATTAEVNADTDTGSTGALLAISPNIMAASKYGQQLPSSAQKDFLDGMVGSIVPTVRDSAPSGFLFCDGSAVSVTTYTSLATVIKGRYGISSGEDDFTADTGNDTLTSNSHGLSDGDSVFVDSTGTLPGGLSANTVYYVINSTLNTFQLSTSSGGSAVDITSTGSGTHSAYSDFVLPDLRSATLVGAGQRTETFDFTDSDVNTSTDRITVDSNEFLYTGQAVALTNSGGSVPTGLSETTYYVIRVNATTIELATSVANANDGTSVDITGASGGGTHTLTLTMTNRSLGDEGGEETHSLSDSEMPSHSHDIEARLGTGSGGNTILADAENNSFTPKTTEDEGGDSPQNNMPPFVTVNYMIKT